MVAAFHSHSGGVPCQVFEVLPGGRLRRHRGVDKGDAASEDETGTGEQLKPPRSPYHAASSLVHVVYFAAACPCGADPDVWVVRAVLDRGIEW